MQSLALAIADDETRPVDLEIAPAAASAALPRRPARRTPRGGRLLASLRGIVRPRAATSVEASPADPLEAAVGIVEAQGFGEANLVRMADKEILFSADGAAFVMYARRGRSLIALADPVGPQDRWPGLVDRFVAVAAEAGCRPVFYQISPALLGATCEAGLRSLKLGEQAIVDLKAFDMKGGKWASLRRSTNRAERDGLSFAFLAPAEVPAILPELQAVSDHWLEQTRAREKGFSLGSFVPAYLATQPVAVMRLEGRIVAFASVLVTDRRESAFIDLMRFVPGVHRGMMDLLFVKTMEHLKREGFAALNLGMAPLSGLPDQDGAPLWNQLGRTVFECGESFYNFQGLRAFKSKFEPQWQSRYLAVPVHANPYLAVMDVAILIGGGLRGIFGK